MAFFTGRVAGFCTTIYLFRHVLLRQYPIDYLGEKYNLFNYNHFIIVFIIAFFVSFIFIYIAISLFQKRKAIISIITSFVLTFFVGQLVGSALMENTYIYIIPYSPGYTGYRERMFNYFSGGFIIAFIINFFIFLIFIYIAISLFQIVIKVLSKEKKEITNGSNQTKNDLV